MPAKTPPGPRDWCLGFSILPKLKANFIDFYRDAQAQHGDVVCLQLGPYRDYTFFHPDHIRELLVTQAKHFIRFEVPIRVLSQWNRNSLLMVEGEAWTRQRRMVQPAFHPRRFAGYTDAMAGIIDEKLAAWAKTAGADGSFELELSSAMTDLTLQVIGKTLFGADLRDEAADIGLAVAYLSEIGVQEFTSPFVLPDWLPLEVKRRKRWAIAHLDGVVRGFIRQWRANNQDRGDLLSMLLLAVDDEGDKARMTDEQVRDEAMTLLLAGHDTTAAGLVWCLYHLAKFPEVCERVRAEGSKLCGARLPTQADVAHMSYTERVVKESLRLFPPAIGVFGRRPIHPVTIGGYEIPTNGICRAFTYSTQRDPRWFPEPERFDPDRFLPEHEKERPQFAYFPFGGGPRACIGQHFAMTEMILATSLFAQRYDLSLLPGQPPPDQSQNLRQNLSLRPKHGLRVKLRPVLGNLR